MDVLQEEKKCQEGKELALELMRHGVSDCAIGDILGVEQKTAYNWRKRLRESGWDGTLETYETQGELERKMEELSKYTGLYTKSAIIKRWDKKRELFKNMFEQGMDIKEIAGILNVTAETLHKWKRGKINKGQESDEWIPVWRKEWDEFMQRLVRPIRLAERKA